MVEPGLVEVVVNFVLSQALIGDKGQRLPDHKAVLKGGFAGVIVAGMIGMLFVGISVAAAIIVCSAIAWSAVVGVYRVMGNASHLMEASEPAALASTEIHETPSITRDSSPSKTFADRIRAHDEFRGPGRAR